MKRGFLTAAVTAVLLTLSAAAASAHPLGNFTINHLSKVRISSNRIDVQYVLDQAEIPTFEERGTSAATVLQRKRDEAARGLRLIVDGAAVPLRPVRRGSISFPPGQGGLKLTRVELDLSARVSGAHSVELRDATFADRLG